MEIWRYQPARHRRVVESEVAAVPAREGDNLDPVFGRLAQLVQVSEQEGSGPQTATAERPRPYAATAVRALSVREHDSSSAAV
jgi:hypothetical protein